MGLTSRKTARKIRRLKGSLAVISKAYPLFTDPDFLTLSNWSQCSAVGRRPLRNERQRIEHAGSRGPSRRLVS